ncbi:MAG: transcription elongation factor NusA [archaeon]
MPDIKEALEKMLDVLVEKIEEEEEKLIVYVNKELVGRAIGPSGSVVRSAELILGTAIEVRGI